MATITSATSGNSNATGTWTGGVVPVSGDKVIIAHPGTNNLSSTPYVLNGAASLGTTTIPVTGGTGTIVAGECVQFEHQIGTDEDGQPIHDNTYYQVTTGITGNGSLVITPGLAYAMASGVRVVNRGHVVTLAASHTWGDDTSSTTSTSNGVVVNGTLRASRTTSQTLTARGTIFYATGGTIDYGVHGVDPIPDTVQAICRLNDSAALAVAKHGLVSQNTAGATFRACGKNRKRNTSLSSLASAGTTTLSIADSTGWESGDRIVIDSDTEDPARAQVVTISGSGPNWTISPALTIARASETLIGNLSSNVSFTAFDAARPAVISHYVNDANGSVRLRHVSFVNVGNNTGWVGGSQNNPSYYGSFGTRNPLAPSIYARSCATETTSSAGAGAGPATHGQNRNKVFFIDWAIFAGTSTSGFYPGGNSTSGLYDSVVYRAGTVVNSQFDGGAVAGEMVNCQTCAASATALAGNNITSFKVSGGTHKAAVRHNTIGIGKIVFENATLNSPGFSAATAAALSGEIEYLRCNFIGGSLSSSLTSGAVPSQAQVSRLIAVNGIDDDHRVRSYYQETTTDLTTRKRSTYAVKIQPKVASTPITYVFALPAVAGVAQVIKGALRFDATYGTATPPSIALAGQGVSQSFTAPATADAWHDFSFSFTPTSTGDITATVTVQSASTSGFAWLDGVYHYPMTQSVRHFGYLWQPQAAQVADPLITVSEATALAYPVTVDHATNTITITANATTADVWHACMADLVQTANQGEAQHITGGPTFTTSYDVVVETGATLTGAFATSGTVTTEGSGLINGVYTDSTGRHVRITAPELLAGSRVQLYNLTDGAELLNTELTGDGLSHPLTHSADKTIRLRVAKVGYLPIEATGVLSASGLSFLNSQVADVVYVANGIDGATCTEFAPDYPNLQIEVTDPDNITSVQRIYAWTRWANWVAADGIRLMHNAVQAQDSANYSIDVTVVDAHFQNMNTAPLMVVGGYIKRSDGTTVIAAGGSIQMDPGRAYVAAGASAITVPAGERVITMAATGEVFARA